MIAIIMTLVAIGGVTANEVVNAKGKVNGMQGPVQFWNPNNSTCAPCQLIGANNCSTTETLNPCMCSVTGSPSQLARVGVAPIDNCVQLYRQ